MVSDPLALQHVLNSNHFEHGPSIDNAVSLLFEEKCVMAAKGEIHKRLRAAMQIGFTSSAARECLPLFEKIAQAVTERFGELAGLPADIIPVLSEATLNAISQATLSSSTQDLGQDFVLNNTQIMALASSQSAVQIIAEVVAVRLPKWVWRAAMHLPTRTFNNIRTAKCFAREIGERTIREKIEAGRQGQTDVFDMLLDLGRREKRRNALTKEEVAAQTGILFIAGQDNTTSLLAFGLLELGRHPQCQTELRAEIQHFLGNRSEGFRLSYSACPGNAQIIPSRRAPRTHGHPRHIYTFDNCYQDLNWELTNQIIVRKGQVVSMAIASYHRFETLWGEDAHEFRPSRWLDGTAYQGQALGPYANLLSFLGGPRVCLGWRFALLEIQVFFFELVSKFSFALPKDDSDSFARASPTRSFPYCKMVKKALCSVLLGFSTSSFILATRLTLMASLP
ncbi:cytochrome P450 [Mycena leptocephala]|nr:cytochrome P450 [Mycena leptocephala]